ncbi:hypothetical protein [Allosphingosinicella sp.]|uniref:hypothetical protein n=1 Tax=Allosphingosinicella sp. TaxID=2823234 RepID=UPI002EF6443F
MMSALLALAALASTPSAIPVDAGRANWSDFPALARVERSLPTLGMVEEVETMLRDGQCRIAGQRPTNFDITVPYLVLVQPDGSAARIVVADMGCPDLEAYVGSIVTALSQAGDFRPTGQQRARWYASNINFNLDD